MTRAPGRSSIRSRWTGHGAAGGRTRTTIPWSRTATSAPGSTGHGCPQDPAQCSRRGVQRDLRPAALAPGPGLVAFYVSTGARASELLSATLAGVDPGRQLITVIRKGTRELQELPASADAFVWLRLYQAEMAGLIPTGRRQPLWWTLRRPVRPLTYHAVHRMFERVNDQAGTSATLHSLRHTAAYRMADDPALPLTDVQFVLGHAQLTTTQIYLTPRKEEVIRRILAHYLEQTRQAAARARPAPAPGYRPETLDVLFRNGAS